MLVEHAAQQYRAVPTVGNECYSWTPDTCSSLKQESKAGKNERARHKNRTRREMEKMKCNEKTLGKKKTS